MFQLNIVVSFLTHANVPVQFFYLLLTCLLWETKLVNENYHKNNLSKKLSPDTWYEEIVSLTKTMEIELCWLAYY